MFHFWDFFFRLDLKEFPPPLRCNRCKVQRRPLIKFNAVLFFGEARWEWVKLCKLTGFGWIYIHRNLTPSLPLKIGWKNPKGRRIAFQASFFWERFVKFRGVYTHTNWNGKWRRISRCILFPFSVLEIEDFRSYVSVLEGTSHFYFGVALQPSPTQTKKKCVRDQAMESIQLGFSSWGGSLPKFFFI